MKLIPVSQGKFAQVDDEDYEWLSGFKWSLVKGARTEYATTPIKAGDRYRNFAMHRMILDPPDDVLVDHRDLDGLNNTRDNLRTADHSKNHANAEKRRGQFLSQYKGLSISPSGKWVASITVRTEAIHLGSWETEREAALAYDAAARHFCGEFCRPNIPDEAPFTFEEMRDLQKAALLAKKKSPYRGVMPDSRGPGFRAAIRIRGKLTSLGYFRCEEDAARAYDAAERAKRGPKAKTNFPEEATLV